MDLRKLRKSYFSFPHCRWYQVYVCAILRRIGREVRYYTYEKPTKNFTGFTLFQEPNFGALDHKLSYMFIAV